VSAPAAEGPRREDQCQLDCPIGAGSIGWPAAGCYPRGIELQRRAAISRSKAVRTVRNERFRRLHPSFIDATDNIIGTIGPAHYRGGSAADTDAVGAACTATGADRGGVVSTRTCATPSAVGGYITGRASPDVVGSACAASGRDSGNAAGAGVSIACGTTGTTGNRDGGAVGQRLRADATRTADAGHSVCRAAAGG